MHNDWGHWGMIETKKRVKIETNKKYEITVSP